MIIASLLDTDLYKFTMMQVVLHQFPGAQVTYRFNSRVLIIQVGFKFELHSERNRKRLSPIRCSRIADKFNFA